MSESYKTHSDELYFISFSVVGWLDVFARREYQDILVESIAFCQKNKGLSITQSSLKGDSAETRDTV